MATHKKINSKTDWAKVDATTEEEINRQAKEDDTLLTDEQLKAMRPIADFPELQALTKRGRPRQDSTKQSTTLRLNPDIIRFFKKNGQGWQTRINEVLQEYVDEHRQNH